MRSRKDFKRKSGNRDAKLIAIATEGDKTEKVYFEGLLSFPQFKNPRIHVEVLPKLSRASSPKHVIAVLNDFNGKYNRYPGDQLWLVIDVDRWESKMLKIVTQECQQKGFNLAVSNPCFEFWLLLHLVDYNLVYSVEKKKNLSSCRNVNKELKEILKGYNKLNLKIEYFIEGIKNAIVRGKRLDDGNRWPQSSGSQVCYLVENIITA